MKFLKELLSDRGAVSSMRVMSLLSLVIAGYIAVRGLELHADLSTLAMLCGTFLSAGFAGKVFQKNIEVKQTNVDVDQQK